MVTAKNVKWTESAKKDLYSIYARIANNNVERAKEMVKTILEETASLKTEYPKGAPEPLLKNEKEPYKYIFASFYKVVYSILGEDIIIETLYHKRQEATVA